MTDMTELFSRDPLSLTNENIDQIIEEMRKKRHLFNAGGSTAGKPKPKLSKGQEATKGLDLDIDL